MRPRLLARGACGRRGRRGRGGGRGARSGRGRDTLGLTNLKASPRKLLQKLASFAVQHSHESRLARTFSTMGANNHSLVHLCCLQLCGCLLTGSAKAG